MEMWTTFVFRKAWKIAGLQKHYYVTKAAPLGLNKALVISKMTRYELELFRKPKSTETEIEKKLRKKGTDFGALKTFYNVHKKYETFVVQTLETMGMETRIVNRTNCNRIDLDWCDVVFPVGGDGTFLLAASYIQNNEKPVIGLNSDPSRSEGYLCLPKQYSADLQTALKKISMGSFSWMMRSRIRITLKGTDVSRPPVQMHNLQLLMPEHRFSESKEKDLDDSSSNRHCTTFSEKRLPYLALNEVFIGECLSARVSYFELQLPEHPKTKVKSSGLCVCTGTGSTSWHMSMNRMTRQSVEQILKCARVNSSQVDKIVLRYNNDLIFNPEETKLGYTIRDLISAGVWPHPPGLPPRGFSKTIDVHSKCIDAGLVIDGGISYPFNDGTVAILEIHPDDSLRTLVLTV